MYCMYAAVYVLDPNRRKELIETYIRKPKYSVQRVQLLCEVGGRAGHTYIHAYIHRYSRLLFNCRRLIDG